MHWFSQLFYMEAKFGGLRQKDKKRLTSIEIQFFRRTAEQTLFYHKRNENFCKS